MYGKQVTAIASEQIEMLCGTFIFINQFLLGCGVPQQTLGHARQSGPGGKAGYLMRVLDALDADAPDLFRHVLDETTWRLTQSRRHDEVARLESAITSSTEGREPSAAAGAEGAAESDAESSVERDRRAPAQADTVVTTTARDQMEWDVFICHASENKTKFVRPLAERLQKEGLRVWYDEFTLTIGDSLRRKIDEGLARSRYGVVVLSHAFFQGKWPQDELDGLVARERNGEKVILPVWLDVGYDDVAEHSPMLAGRLAAKVSDGMDKVVFDLMLAMGMESNDDPDAPGPPAVVDDDGSGGLEIVDVADRHERPARAADDRTGTSNVRVSAVVPPASPDTRRRGRGIREPRTAEHGGPLPNRDALARAIGSFMSASQDLIERDRELHALAVAWPNTVHVDATLARDSAHEAYVVARRALDNEKLVAGDRFAAPISDFITLVVSELAAGQLLGPRDLAFHGFVQTGAIEAVRKIDEIIAGGPLSAGE